VPHIFRGAVVREQVVDPCRCCSLVFKFCSMRVSLCAWEWASVTGLSGAFKLPVTPVTVLWLSPFEQEPRGAGCCLHHRS
jgi:hypothetical protein